MKVLKRSLQLLGLNPYNRRCNSLFAANVQKKSNYDEKMEAWQIHSYGGIDELKLQSIKTPIISRTNQVLIRVEAASVNPIDVAMINGYGATAINLWRKTRQLETGTNLFDATIEFPLTMGRDFAGVVVSKGHDVDDRLRIGDSVWGVVPIKEQGCHATHVLVDSSLVRLKPENLTPVEAASIPYAGLTAWSSLWITGGLIYKRLLNIKMNRSVLVIGGSGGVGTIAIQLLKSWNMRVITTCSSDAVEMLENIGADTVVNYKEDNADSIINSEGPYEIILDCANQGVEVAKSKGYKFKNYITLNPPLLKNIDAHGLIGGSIKNLGDLIKQNLPMSEQISTVKWGFFFPCENGLIALHELVEKRKLLPVINKVYSFNELPEAYTHVSEGHLRGKIVINMNQN